MSDYASISNPGAKGEDDQVPELVGGTYRIIKKIASGSFGAVYLGESTITGENVAVKLEKSKKGSKSRPRLQLERHYYEMVKDGKGVPRIHWFGVEQNYTAMVMDLLGFSLHDLFVHICGGSFSLKTVLILADQMIRRVRFIHECGLVHRDLKPENFLMGTGVQHKMLYLIDLGLAKDIPKEPWKANKQDSGITGTPRYASIPNHLGVTQSCRDDMESLGYILIYFLKGKLPWQELKPNWTKKQKLDKISERKLSIPVETLCEGLPQEFLMYVKYSRNLKYRELPDYDYVLSLFRNLYLSQHFQYDCDYDWSLKLKELENKCSTEFVLQTDSSKKTL